jgi:hypothetical protein
MLMIEPGWYYREEIEYQLDRLGATTWRYQEQSDGFVVGLEAAPGEVELRSDVYGAVLNQPAAFLATLSRLRDRVGDDRIAEALLRRPVNPEP